MEIKWCKIIVYGFKERRVFSRSLASRVLNENEIILHANKPCCLRESDVDTEFWYKYVSKYEANIDIAEWWAFRFSSFYLPSILFGFYLKALQIDRSLNLNSWLIFLLCFLTRVELMDIFVCLCSLVVVVVVDSLSKVDLANIFQNNLCVMGKETNRRRIRLWHYLSLSLCRFLHKCFRRWNEDELWLIMILLGISR